MTGMCGQKSFGKPDLGQMDCTAVDEAGRSIRYNGNDPKAIHRTDYLEHIFEP